VSDYILRTRIYVLYGHDTTVVLRARLYTFIVTKGRIHVCVCTAHGRNCRLYILDRSQNTVDHSRKRSFLGLAYNVVRFNARKKDLDYNTAVGKSTTVVADRIEITSDDGA